MSSRPHVKSGTRSFTVVYGSAMTSAAGLSEPSIPPVGHNKIEGKAERARLRDYGALKPAGRAALKPRYPSTVGTDGITLGPITHRGAIALFRTRSSITDQQTPAMRTRTMPVLRAPVRVAG